jgi:hypothetical protein
MLVGDDFKAKVNSKFPLVARSGGYELHLQKSGKELIFHLVDPNAKYVYEYFIGIIKTENEILKNLIEIKKDYFILMITHRKNNKKFFDKTIYLE